MRFHLLIRYALIGPYTQSAEFEEIPPSKLTADVIDAVQEKHGVKVVTLCPSKLSYIAQANTLCQVYYGRWLVKGYPKVFLIDMGSSWHRVDEWRSELQGNFAVSYIFLTLCYLRQFLIFDNFCRIHMTLNVTKLLYLEIN